MQATLYDISDSQSPDAMLSVLLFEVGGELFALNVNETEGVVDCPPITPLPGAPEGIIGVGSVRGRMTLVVDLSSGAESIEKRRLILIKGEGQLGLLASRVEGVVTLTEMKEDLGGKARKKLIETEMAAGFAWPVSAHFAKGSKLIPIIDIELLADVW